MLLFQGEQAGAGELLCSRPERLAADKGYSYPSVRAEVRRRVIAAVIPTRSNQWVAYAGRNRVERCVNRLKQFRRVATRYEKRACNYLAMVKLAAALIWL